MKKEDLKQGATYRSQAGGEYRIEALGFEVVLFRFRGLKGLFESKYPDKFAEVMKTRELLPLNW